jgi:iron complex outermembrane receptor protein
MCIRKRFSRSVLSILALPFASASGFFIASPASAQESDDQVLDEIIVTSRYREERLQQTPIAITALTGADLEFRAFHNAYEVGYAVPNASLRPAQAAFGNTMSAFIRGIGQYDFDFAFEPGVGIYIDDVYHPFTMGSQIDLLDIDRVEVLRGPQGTLFGRGAIGGVIRYVSEPPQGDGTGSVSVTVGDYDRVDVRGSYDFAIVEDRLFARIAGMSKSRDGHQDVIDFACAFPAQAGNLNPRSQNQGLGCSLGTQGGEDITGARGALRWVATDDLQFTVTAEYLDDDSEARADTLTGVAPVQDFYRTFVLNNLLDIDFDSRFLPPNPYVTYATYDDPLSGLSVIPQTTFEKTSISAVVDWALTDTMSAKLILANSEISSAFATDADGSPLNIQTVDGYTEMETTTAELRLSGRAMDRLDWTVGGFYYDGTADATQTVSIPWLSYLLDVFLPNPFGPSILLGDITFEEGAALIHSDPTTYTFVKSNNLHDASHESVYAHIVFDLTDRLAISAGGRYSSDEKVVEFDNTRVVNPRVVVEDDRTDWKVGLDFTASDDVMVYGSVATGYRPGAYNSRPFQATQVVAVDAEDAVSYDLGMKWDLFDNRLRLNLAAFFFDYETRILPVGGTECPLLDLGPPPVYATVDPSTPGAVQDSLGQFCTTTVSRTFYTNGPAEITGYEAEIQWRPTDNLTVSGQIGILSWESPDIDDCDGDLDGVPDPGRNCISDLPPLVPDENWSLGVSYDFPVGSGSTVTPRVDLYAQTETCFLIDSPEGCVDSYELVNAAVMWASPEQAWTITLGVTNLTDEEYYLNAFDLIGFGQPTAEKQPGRPSEWYVTFKRNFN